MTLAELAGEVVAAVEPEQERLLAGVTRRWERGAGGHCDGAGHSGGSVGFGVDPAVLSELIYPVLVGTFSQLFGTMAVQGWGRRGWLRRRRGGSPPTALTRVTVEVERLDEVRAACLHHARTLGLSPAKAEVLADAVAGALSRRVADLGGAAGRDGDG